MLSLRTPMNAFLVYTVCFGVGLLFTLLSALTAHVFDGHGGAGHVGDAGGAHGHVEAGISGHGMPGFSPVSPTTLASFITAFGGFGMICSSWAATRSPWVSAPIAALGGFAVAAGVFFLFNAIFSRTQGSSEGRVADLVGLEATVITPIAAGAVGEIAYVQDGSRYSAPARSADATNFANGATVRITRIAGTQFYVGPAR
jgi:membrane protein implicated in regulation of membrane protease activity